MWYRGPGCERALDSQWSSELKPLRTTFARITEAELVHPAALRVADEGQ
jgi:hypothetical protein